MLPEDSALRIVAFIAAIGPPFIFILYFLASARMQANTELLWASFGFGASAAFPVVVLALFFEALFDLGAGVYAASASRAFLGAAIPEELFKLLALLALCGRQLQFFRSNHIFALSVAAALGFAALENILYVIGGGNWGTIAVLRSITAVPGHAFVGAVMGYCVARAVHGSSSLVWWVSALVLPITLHGLYDFFIFVPETMAEGALDQYGSLPQIFAAGFFVTVILEGLLAHLLLTGVLKDTGAEAGHFDDDHGQATYRGRQPFYENPATWSILGILGIFGAAAMFWVTLFYDLSGFATTEQASQIYGYTFAVFSLLHGLAFFGLAIVQQRRQRSPWLYAID